MTPIVFALCYSADWAPHVRIEVHALQATNPGARVYLLSDADGRLDLPGCQFVDVEDLFQQRCGQDKSINSRFTRYAHYRLLLPEVVPEERVLYIDADAIVDGDLSEFWDTGLAYLANLETGTVEQALVAGAQDIGVDKPMLKAIGATVGDTYLNAGVLLMNLEDIRRKGVYEAWLHEINTTAYACGDQCVVNKVCRPLLSVVSNEYNSSLSTGFHPHPKIMHWAGPADQKPWASRNVLNHHIWQRWADAYAAAHPAPRP